METVAYELHWTGIVATIAAIISVGCASLFFLLNRNIERDARKHDVIQFGKPHRSPSIQHQEHSDAVVCIGVANLSRRAIACIKKVEAFDRGGRPIDIAWSAEIDNLGNPMEPRHIVAIDRLESLFIRRGDGERIGYMKITIHHSFSNDPVNIEFD